MWIDDDILQRAGEPLVVSTWVPSEPLVVLGRSNKLDREVNLPWCRAHRIQLLQRYGGGGTVVLYPGCLVVTVGCWVTKAFHNDGYFRSLNQAVIACAKNYDERIALEQRGISDITLADRKIGGTSLFRSGRYLLYQASLICELDIDLINNCLSHPSSEPDYRRGRAHKEFLADLGPWGVKPQALKQHMDMHLEQEIIAALRDELAEVVPKHLDNLKKRRSRGLAGEGYLS